MSEPKYVFTIGCIHKFDGDFVFNNMYVVYEVFQLGSMVGKLQNASDIDARVEMNCHGCTFMFGCGFVFNKTLEYSSLSVPLFGHYNNHMQSRSNLSHVIVF